MRFLIHWALRREELCAPGLCPDAPDEGGRCDHCPLDKLDAAECSAAGLLLRRAVDLSVAIKLGLHVGFGDILADEFAVLSLLNEERDKCEAASGNPQTQPRVR